MFRYVKNTALTLFWRANLLFGKTVVPREDVLKALLSRNPVWTAGHRTLAQLAFQNGNTKLAYSSSHCFLTLARRPKDKALALSMLARCYTAGGDATTALAYFDKSCAIFPADLETIEHIAAAHILARNFAAAAKLLISIGDKNLTPQAKAALTFAQSKLATDEQIAPER